MRRIRYCWRRAEPPGPRAAHKRLSGESFYQLHQHYVQLARAEERWLNRLGIVARLLLGLLLMTLWMLLY